MGRKSSSNARSAPARARRVLSSVVELVALVMVPVVLAVCAVLRFEQAALLSILVVAASLVLFFAGYEKGRPRLRDTMPVAVLAAVAAAGRILFAPIPDFKPVSAIAIIAGAAFGRRSGFMVGALAAFVSNLFFGQGPWTPWQMYGWGLVGYLGGVLAAAGLFGSVEPDLCASRARKVARLVPLAIWGIVSGYVYGLVLNLWSVIGFYHPQDISQILVVYAAALPFDTLHGVATAFFLLVLYRPWLRKLARIRRKYALHAGEQGA